MGTIKVQINKNLQYNIDVKETYDAVEFVTDFSQHIKKLSEQVPNITIYNPFPFNHIRSTNKYVVKLFEQLNRLIHKLGREVEQADRRTMRTYTSMVNDRRKGLAWLQPNGNQLFVYFRKHKQGEIQDRHERVLYNKPGNSTFGEYPMMKVRNDGDVEIAYNIIQQIYAMHN